MDPTDLPQSLVPNYTGIKQRILELLGSSQLAPSVVADAVGVNQSYVTQLLSEEEFARAVAQLRFEKLKKAAKIDDEYEEIELKLIKKLKDCLEFMYKPAEILVALRIINGAKRRGVGIPGGGSVNVQVVNLVLPVKLVQRFKTNAQNQVVEADGQSLVTVASNVLLKEVEPLEGKESEAERPAIAGTAQRVA